MKIEYQDYGAVASIVITSTVFEFRKHNRVVDTALFSTLGIVANRSGIFFMKSVLSGKSRDMLRAYKTILREEQR
ncbi:hypothetical protein LL845_002250 [Salmonella enterica]|uniref:Uncharacterized protein n=5 Tax=Salmonella enterica TaxID=28901 RepID=A0A632GKK0_SALNE|nr:hypothetical protein [Salmonella enterica]EAB6029743.1 hypothetical protein [Salmonella enterica subsp. enterica serovar Java]EAB7708061.1 hypothetical protein [Salmonella enterica subsp. enterica serovar Javiana]EAB9993674.1 hypothetical protein [Salmonella enterica subsp. enterica serovar Bonariensis]EAM3805119.1 hypothetical protein [Salmonella enterica subsp. enterica serovar Hartford]EBU8673395.1 hypothetical protein [Salmonella enterica subsp. enterica serovar Panama]EBV8391717.1 hyp